MPAMERMLIGAWNMIEGGMKPSDAVTVGVEPFQHTALVNHLGVSSLRALDRMSESALRRLLGHTAIA